MQAAALFAAGYADLRARVPAMPAKWGRPATVLPLLAELEQSDPMAGAFRGEQLVGYLGGKLHPARSGGEKAVYCAEWAHAVAATESDRGWIYSKLYEELGAAWVARGCHRQALTMLASDPAGLEAWVWLGFGMLVVDMVRSTDGPGEDLAGGPTGTSDANLTIRTATPADLKALFPVAAAHEVYYRQSPMFLPNTAMTDPTELESTLADPQTVTWLAVDHRDGVIGFMRGELGAQNACQVVRDVDTLACTGAFVLPAARRRGAGRMLMAAMVDWARDNGLARLALDFESANIYGRAFWQRHLTPVCYSVLRVVDSRIAGTGSGSGTEAGG